MPYLARGEGQSEEEYEKALKEFNEKWYSYIADGKKEMRDIFLKASLAMEKESEKQAQPLGVTNDNSHDPQVPAPTVAERRAAREAAREEAQRVAIERAERRRELVQKFRWLREQTECDWCGAVAARLEFAQLDRDEAGLPKENDEGFRNSCTKCADRQGEAEVD